MNVVRRIQIYGDSIMKGILLDHKSSRYYPQPPTNLNAFKEEFALDILNKSKFGCTIGKGCQQLCRPAGTWTRLRHGAFGIRRQRLRL